LVVATAKFELLHTPPDVASVSTVDAPVHTVDAPEIAAGAAGIVVTVIVVMV
jgi:hypothetical protein